MHKIKIIILTIIFLIIAFGCEGKNNSPLTPEESLNSFLDSLNSEFTNVPGFTVSIINDGKIEYSNGFGVIEEKSSIEVSPQTMFQGASLSKLFTAVTALKIAEYLDLDIDRNVNDYLNSWKVTDNEHTEDNYVTLRRLLSHTSGLNVPGFQGYSQDKKLPTLLQILSGEPPSISKAIEVIETPGSTWSYSGGGYLVIQQLLEDQLKMRFYEIVDSLILHPLNLRNSSFHTPIDKSRFLIIASGHNENGNVIQGKWNNYPESAAAGLWTTSEDLAKFAIAISDKQSSFLSLKVKYHLFTPESGSFSLGLLIRGSGENRWFTYNGGNTGYRCIIYKYIDRGKGCVIMTNSDKGFDLSNIIIKAIATLYKWPEFVPE